MALVSAKNAHPDILSFCFSSGLTFGKGRIQTLLIEAACYSSTIPPIAVLLDQGGVDINHCIGRLGNPLISATYRGGVELMKYLLAKGADPNNGHNFFGFNALVAAVAGSKRNGGTTAEMLRALFQHGADTAGTALIAAADLGHVEAVRVILEIKGNEIDLETVADYLSAYRRTIMDDLGTALYRAAARGHAEIADILVRKGADMSFMDRIGRSVAEIARTNGHLNLAARLEQLMSLWDLSP
ncbi:MAG: hypothetical protein Q9178_006018 [Gyalolechia marmorata]